MSVANCKAVYKCGCQYVDGDNGHRGSNDLDDGGGDDGGGVGVGGSNGDSHKGRCYKW